MGYCCVSRSSSRSRRMRREWSGELRIAVFIRTRPAWGSNRRFETLTPRKLVSAKLEIYVGRPGTKESHCDPFPFGFPAKSRYRPVGGDTSGSRVRLRRHLDATAVQTNAPTKPGSQLLEHDSDSAPAGSFWISITSCRRVVI